MKIVIDARELRTSSGRYIERLINYLQDIDHVNNYIILLKPKDISGWRTESEHFMAVECPHDEFSFDEQLAFKKQLDGLKPDLVHFGYAQQPVLYKGTVVTTIHDLTTVRFNNPAKNKVVFKLKQLIYKEVIRRAAHKSAAILTPTQFVKDDLAAFAKVSSDKITVTLEAADPIQSPADALPDLQNKQFIMYVGRPTPHKNLERLLEAFALLHPSHPSLHLVLAGRTDKNYESIARLVQQKGTKNIIFTDYISDGQLRWLYENCAAYVFPSLSEGFGLPGLEAMQHGAPVVSSDATCLPEVYGEAAHYFDPTNAQTMADAINEVLTDKDLRLELVAAGHLKAQEYSWRRMAKQTLAIYQSVLKS